MLTVSWQGRPDIGLRGWLHALRVRQSAVACPSGLAAREGCRLRGALDAGRHHLRRLWLLLE